MYTLKDSISKEETIDIDDMKVGDLGVVITEDVGTTGHIILRSGRFLVDLTEPENDWRASDRKGEYPVQIRLLRPFEKITLEVRDDD